MWNELWPMSPDLGSSREERLGSEDTYPVKTRQSRVQMRMRTWLNMAEWVL